MDALAVLHPSVSLADRVRVGEGTVLHPGVVAYADVEIGARCLVHAGSVIGSDGFGFEPTQEGWEKIPQCGTVVIEDDVEIGANVTIDRGRFGATRIGRAVKIDNLVHVGPTCRSAPVRSWSHRSASPDPRRSESARSSRAKPVSPDT